MKKITLAVFMLFASVVVAQDSPKSVGTWERIWHTNSNGGIIFTGNVPDYWRYVMPDKRICGKVIAEPDDFLAHPNDFPAMENSYTELNAAKKYIEDMCDATQNSEYFHPDVTRSILK